MSTRALYTVRDETAAYNVYKHCDGYPSGAAAVIRHAIDYFAWPLPRFEADEFAAALIAAGKAVYFADYLDTHKSHRRRRGTLSTAVNMHTGDYGHGGNLRLMPQGDPDGVALRNCTDIQYRYELMMGTGGAKLIIKAIAWEEQPHKRRTIFYGPFQDFERGAKTLDNVGPNYTIYNRPPGEGKTGTRREQPKPLQHVSTGDVA